jgi:hypothetical protein
VPIVLPKKPAPYFSLKEALSFYAAAAPTRRFHPRVGTQKQGIYRIYDSKIEHFGSAHGLSSDLVNELFEDREGNLWAGYIQGCR